MRAIVLCSFGLLVLAIATTVGCGSDDPAAPEVGAIAINPEPDSIDAPWQLVGPNGFSQSGTGNTTLTDRVAGSYTLTWGAVADWTAPIPLPMTQFLAANATVTFTGVYIEDAMIPAGFVLIPPGTFMMGSPMDEPLREVSETQHQVTLTHGLFVQATEVTNQQYRDMAQWAYDNGHIAATSSFLYDFLDGSTEILAHLGAGDAEISFSAGEFNCTDPTHPVKYVTWYGAVAYCDWLSLQQNLPRAYSHRSWQCNAGNPYSAAGYRLPTEAEWEYACRSGTQTPFSTGLCLGAGTEANYRGTDPYPGCPAGPFPNWTIPVGSCTANAFGLYDMHGNVFEWCNDWFGDYGGTVTDPVGAGMGYGRMARGASFDDLARYCRSACRLAVADPRYTGGAMGLRPVRSAY